MVEISFMFIIILGRWIVPKGNISHSTLSQLLLVYLSLASDILDLLTLFNEEEIQLSLPMVHLVLTVFSLCMFQFALNLTATRGRSFRAEFDNTEIEVHQSAPSQPVTPVITKSMSHQRQIFTRLSSGSTTLSTIRPLATQRKAPIISTESPIGTGSIVNLSDIDFESKNAIRRNASQLDTTHLGTEIFIFMLL